MTTDGEGTELVLRRAPEDRRRFDLPGFGSVRRQGWLSWALQITAKDGRSWLVQPRGVFRRTADAVSATGSVSGSFDQTKILSHTGTLTWEGAPYELRSVSSWKHRYELGRGGVVLATIQDSGWGKAPVKVVLGTLRPDAGLLLYAMALVQLFTAQDNTASAAATT